MLSHEQVSLHMSPLPKVLEKPWWVMLEKESLENSQAWSGQFGQVSLPTYVVVTAVTPQRDMETKPSPTGQ